MRFTLQTAAILAASLLSPMVVAGHGIGGNSFDAHSMHRVRINKHGELSGDLSERQPNLVELHPRAFDFSTQTIRGVNIGGWLVAEPFITPSLFEPTPAEVVDEWQFGKLVSNAKAKLQNHWATWVTEDTFRQIAQVDYINFVRIPIGYWAVDTSKGEPYVRANQLDYLEKGVRWAKQYGLKVMLDLHGAPGSQNGFDNSGQRLPNNIVRWPNNQTNADRTKNALITIAKRFSTSEFRNTVVAIEVLNEPAAYKDSRVLPFYRRYANDAYYGLRYDTIPGSVNNDLTVALHDAFSRDYWYGEFQKPTYQNVILDSHEYSMFSPGQNGWSKATRLQHFCDLRSELRRADANLPTIVGEWTAAPNDCAKWLNGRGRGSRYEGNYDGEPRTGSCSGRTGNVNGFSSTYKALLRDMFATQSRVFETGSGWIFWCHKTENAPEWSFLDGVRNGWIPKTLGDRVAASC